MAPSNESTFVANANFRERVEQIIAEFPGLATDLELTEHATDTTEVHGIVDTAKLITSDAVGITSHFAIFETGRKITDSGWVKENDGTLANNSDAVIPSQKAVKTYVDTKLLSEHVGTTQLKNGAVTTSKLGEEAVETANIKPAAVTRLKLALAAVGEEQLANNAVTEAKIENGSVSTAKMFANQVTTTIINALAVTEAKLAAEAVSLAKMTTAAKQGFLPQAQETVASAATITVTRNSTLVNITGVTGINKINATAAGHVIVLKFAEVLTVTDGENLKLLTNFVTTADDTLTLICNGTNWYEIARSAN